MTETKPISRSLTIWGGLLALIPSVASALASMAGVAVEAGEVSGVLTNITTAVGGILAIIGRARATKLIG